MALDLEELDRYARHTALPEIGRIGQERLKDARVLIVGAGGLGCPAALYLTAAGVGTIGLVDPDHVDGSNLQRQILYRTADIGRPKVEVAVQQLKANNPRVDVRPYFLSLNESNACELLSEYDVVLDATDNFSARYLVNDACFFLKKPNIFASVTRFEGRLAVFCAPGPCYRCLFPAPPKDLVLNCAAEGILGTVPGIMGTLQALETIKFILKIGSSLQNSLMIFDLTSLESKRVLVTPNPDCPLCGVNASIKKLQPFSHLCNDTEELLAPEISVTELSNLLQQTNAPYLVDVREANEYDAGTICGALSVPLSKIVIESISLPRDRHIVLFCQSGRRSQSAARVLLKRGYTPLSCLAGGLVSWQKRGRAVQNC